MRPVSGDISSQVSGLPASAPRPSTRQRVCEGRPSGSTFIHQPRVGVAPAERLVDETLVRRRAALDDRPIGLADAARLEQFAELLQRLVMAAEHQAARGLAVEPVGERGLARQAEAQALEIVLQARAALGAAMHGDAVRACR